MYPSLLAHGTESKERLIATTFGPQAASLREDLQKRLQQAVEQIDAIPSLDDLVRSTCRHRARIRRAPSPSGPAPISRPIG